MHDKTVALGTALWGWKVERKEAFKLLDQYYQSGYRYIDTAFNYPINDKARDAHKAASYLSEWINTNNIDDLRIIYKIGSISNKHVAHNNLSYTYLSEHADIARGAFGKNLHCLMIHWDDSEHSSDIEATCNTLSDICSDKIVIGLSGIRSPALYTQFLKEEPKQIHIEFKFNIFTQKPLDYTYFNELSPHYWAYGISGSGLNLDKSYSSSSYVSLAREKGFHDKYLTGEKTRIIKQFIESSPLINSFYELSLAYVLDTNRINGFIIAPSNIAQLNHTLSFIKNNSKENFSIPRSITSNEN